MDFVVAAALHNISIHALREEGDRQKIRVLHSPCIFLSTPSARRATDYETVLFKTLGISIHALREEGDAVRPVHDTVSCHFYPRPPRGGRHSDEFKGITDAKFLSTPSARRATFQTDRVCSPVQYFYPRPPRGGRRQEGRGGKGWDTFLSTPSARRATWLLWSI